MAEHVVTGAAHLVGVPGWRFPRGRLVGEAGMLCEVGRLSWFAVFLGTGQRIRLRDGIRWRMRAMSRSRWVSPHLVDEQGRTVAWSAPGDRNYGINTRDHAYSLNPAEVRRGRAREWVLVEHETQVATIERRPFTVYAEVPVDLGAVVISRVLTAFGILGEQTLMPTMQPQ
jgi:hypothetical protein